MVVTLSWVETYFDKFNKEYFSGILPRPIFKVSVCTTTLFTYGEFQEAIPGSEEKCVIRISDVYEGPEEFFSNTLIHEMIHYYLYFTNNKDKTSHGPNFRRECRRINMFGWKLGRYASNEETKDIKLRYIF